MFSDEFGSGPYAAELSYEAVVFLKNKTVKIDELFVFCAGQELPIERLSAADQAKLKKTVTEKAAEEILFFDPRPQDAMEFEWD